MIEGEDLPRVPLFVGTTVDGSGEPARDCFETSLSKFLGDEEPSDDDVEAELWLVSQLIPKNSPCFLAGDPKVGKTWIALDLGMSVASGEPWLGKFELERSRVLILTLEDSKPIVRQRIWQLARSRDLDPRELDGWLAIEADGPFYFDDQESMQTMNRTVEKFKPSLIIVDSLARSFRGDENSKKDVGGFTRPWAQLCKDFDTAVLVIHHNTKSGGGGPGKKLRGSGDLFATARQVIGVSSTKTDGICQVACEGNYGNLESFRLERRESLTSENKTAVSLSYHEVSSSSSSSSSNKKHCEIDHEILRLLGESPMGTKELRSAVTGRADTVSAQLKALATQGKIARSGSGNRGRWCLVLANVEGRADHGVPCPP